MRLPRSATLLATAIVLTPTPAFAYLDPGAGSIILQSLMAAFAAAAAVISMNVNRLKTLFRRHRRKRDEPPRGDS